MCVIIWDWERELSCFSIAKWGNCQQQSGAGVHSLGLFRCISHLNSRADAQKRVVCAVPPSLPPPHMFCSWPAVVTGRPKWALESIFISPGVKMLFRQAANEAITTLLFSALAAERNSRRPQAVPTYTHLATVFTFVGQLRSQNTGSL